MVSLTCPRCKGTFEAPNEAFEGSLCPDCCGAWMTACRVVAAWLTAGATVDDTMARRPGWDRATLTETKDAVERACWRLARMVRRRRGGHRP